MINYFVLNLECRLEIQDGREEKLDYLFTYKEGMKQPILILKDKSWMLGPLVGLPPLWKRAKSPLRDMNLKTWRF